MKRIAKRIALAVATIAAVVTAAPLFVGVNPAKAENLKMAQVGLDVQVGRDRDERVYRDRDRDRDRRDSDVTVGFGPRGIVVGPRNRCHTVTTTVERDDGRRVTRRERQCD